MAAPYKFPNEEKQSQSYYNLNNLINQGIFTDTWKKIMFKFYDNEKAYNKGYEAEDRRSG